MLVSCGRSGMMICRMYGAALAIAVAVHCTITSEAALAEFKAVEAYDVGNWSFRAVIDDSSAQGACFISKANDQGLLLSIIVEQPKHRVSLAITGSEFRSRLADAADNDLTYVIDDNAPVETMPVLQSASRVYIPLGKNFAATEPLRHGEAIDFRTSAGVIASFGLSGSSRALDALKDCAGRYLNFGAF